MAKAKQNGQGAAASAPIPDTNEQAEQTNHGAADATKPGSDADKTEPRNPVKALRVVSARNGFRRAGMQFGTEPVTLAVEDLTQEQVAAIINEPMLTSVWVLAED